MICVCRKTVLDASHFRGKHYALTLLHYTPIIQVIRFGNGCRNLGFSVTGPSSRHERGGKNATSPGIAEILDGTPSFLLWVMQ
jgi:hypothetical protein